MQKERLQQVIAKLQEEYEKQEANYQKTMARISKEKDLWLATCTHSLLVTRLYSTH